MSSSDWIAISGISLGFFITIMGSVWRIIAGMTKMEVKLDVLWHNHISQSKSPLSLNENGERILATSNIGEFVNNHYNEILSRVRSFKPENAYQAQELLISVVNRYKESRKHRLKLQEISFSTGHDVYSLLFVGALSIRDRVINDLGFA